jgi:carbon monoxide dehydrogenase subunit G
MTVRVERQLEVPADVDQVWSFIADAEKRAEAISVVDGYDIVDVTRTTWHVNLPVPGVSRTVAVETEERSSDPPTYVEFVGRSKVFRVVGEHNLEPLEDGTRLATRFVVDGRLPGVERFFKTRLDDELDNLEAALYADLGIEPGERA